MIIDDINISTFGLKLLNLEGYYDLASRKKILTEPTNVSGDIVFQAKTATVSLLGRYVSSSSLLSNLNAFEILLKSQLNHTIELVGHELSFSGVFANGYDVTSYNGGKIIKITAQITITE